VLPGEPPRKADGFVSGQIEFAIGFALAGIFLQMLTNGRYGYFRD